MIATRASKRKTPIKFKDLEKLVKDWNQVYKVGQRVTYKNDNNQIIITNTRSEAWLLSGHTVVIMIEGKSGCVDLDRVFIAQEPLPAGIKRVAVWDEEGIILYLYNEETGDFFEQLPWPPHWPETISKYIVEKEGFEIEYT